MGNTHRTHRKGTDMLDGLTYKESSELMGKIGRSIRVTGRLSRAILDLPRDTYQAAIVYMEMQRDLADLHNTLFEVNRHRYMLDGMTS